MAVSFDRLNPRNDSMESPGCPVLPTCRFTRLRGLKCAKPSQGGINMAIPALYSRMSPPLFGFRIPSATGSAIYSKQPHNTHAVYESPLSESWRFVQIRRNATHFPGTATRKHNQVRGDLNVPDISCSRWGLTE